MAATKVLIVLAIASLLLVNEQEIILLQTSPDSWAGQAGMKPGEVFRDRLKTGNEGPEMVVIPSGKFRMGDIRRSHDRRRSCERVGG
jgi:formylglycine-generating enzyme required for sulfatase activity